MYIVIFISRLEKEWNFFCICRVTMILGFMDLPLIPPKILIGTQKGLHLDAGFFVCKGVLKNGNYPKKY